MAARPPARRRRGPGPWVRLLAAWLRGLAAWLSPARSRPPGPPREPGGRWGWLAAHGALPGGGAASPLRQRVRTRLADRLDALRGRSRAAGEALVQDPAAFAALRAEARHATIVLAGLSLRGCRLRDVDWRGCVLVGVDFTGADLAGARFEEAVISRCVFLNAHLAGASLGDHPPEAFAGGIHVPGGRPAWDGQAVRLPGGETVTFRHRPPER